MKPTTKPFRATYYNPNKIKDFSKVACPPYDVIDKEKAATLKKRSPYNYCRISLADRKDYNKPSQNLQKWIKEGILIDDYKENYYLYQQKFKVDKKYFSRYGILCLLNMEKKDIFPHEYTLVKPKEDRKKMIAKAKANLSPIFVIAGDTTTSLIDLLKKHTKGGPIIEFTDDEENLNRVWKIDDNKQINKITKILDSSYLIIADGHHRFETSFDYYQKNRGKYKDLNYILSYITVNQPGLKILPTHRIIKCAENGENNFKILQKEFKIEPINLQKLGKKLKITKKFCFGLFWKKKLYFITLKNKDLLDTISSSIYKKSGTYIFHECVLSKLSYEGIAYTHSIEKAKKDAVKDKMVFFLKPASLDSVFDIARAGHKLPQKSTYFYPKIFSGLVLRRFKKCM